MIVKVKVAPGTMKPASVAPDAGKSKFGWPC